MNASSLYRAGQLQAAIDEQIKVENRSQFKKFRVGLTAILESKSGEKFYCATAHSGLKADFHLLKNFTITRG